MARKPKINKLIHQTAKTLGAALCEFEQPASSLPADPATPRLTAQSETIKRLKKQIDELS